MFSTFNVEYLRTFTCLFMIFITAIAFFLLLSVLILIHEWGHYYAAVRAGVVVEEFGFGLPPKAKTLFTYKGTKFTFNWIPFGGFVRLKGENAIEKAEHLAPGSFGAASIFARCVILCAGVFMNFILAVVILTIGFSIGRWVPTYTSTAALEAAINSGQIKAQLGVQVQSVAPDSGATSAAVPVGSIVTAVNNTVVTDITDVTTIQEGERSVVYTLLTGEKLDQTIQKTVNLTDGKAGIVLSMIAYNVESPLRNPIWSLGLALRESYIMVGQTLKGIGQLFVSLASSGRVPQEISGIVGIAQLTHASVQAGLMTYLKLVALLSLSLAALNILPFPALDGGRLMFVLAEAISRRRVNRQFELSVNIIGFLALLILIIIITYHDIARLF